MLMARIASVIPVILVMCITSKVRRRFRPHPHQSALGLPWGQSRWRCDSDGHAPSEAVLLHGTFSQALGNITSNTPINVHIDSNSSSFPCDAPNDGQATFNLLRIYEQVAGPCGAVNALPENRVVLYGWSDMPLDLPQTSDHPISDKRQLVILTFTIPVTP